MSKWMRKGDKVLIVAGNEKGKIGNIISMTKDRVVVQGVNVRKKHVKRTQQTQSAQILDLEMPIHISNVSFCDDAGKKIKVKLRKNEKGSKELVHIVDGTEVLLRSTKKNVK
jgi:large subunit ribosomal protein L24